MSSARSTFAAPQPPVAAAAFESRAQAGWFDEVEAAQPFDYFGGLEYSADVPTPREALGHAIGERFTRQAEMLAYLRELERTSDRVRMHEYGRSHEDRPLVHLVISSPDNLARLDDILAANRRLADPRDDDAAAIEAMLDSNPVVVWLSYNVHGNEASASEAAIRVAYTMAAATNTEVKDILAKVVLVIDPLLNPDGRERYVHGFQARRGVQPDPNRDASEHVEPWPGGRTNHYFFDLNRDWIWLVHPESRHRIEAYRRFLPQLHIDYHEQGYRSPYFFGAGDEPYNKNIPEETKEWIDLYGRANAKVFDAEGLEYSTRERFDYLYPGYGKVTPVYYGAVGMLCEKGGHGFAGLSLEVTEQQTLTLRERARHHFLTSMSYLETSAANRRGQLERFRRFYEGSMIVPESGPRAFVLHASNDTDRLARVFDLCSRHGIEIRRVTETGDVRGLRDYRGGGDAGKVTVAAGSWVIRSDQPMGRLARALFERETEVSSIETYDITAWSVPLVFGLRAHYTNETLDLTTEPLETWARPASEVTGEGSVAMILDAARAGFPAWVGVAMRHAIDARVASEPFEVDGRRFAAGSLIVHPKRNGDRDLEAFVGDVVARGGAVHRASHGITTEGPVLGADANRSWSAPSILIARGAPMSSYNFGEIWHMLDVQYGIPHSLVDVDRIGRVDLDAYDVIVLADSRGSLSSELGSAMDDLRAWIRAGGVVIAIGQSASWANRELLALEGDGVKNTLDPRPGAAEISYSERRARSQEDRVPGSLLLVDVDTSHPLAAGVPSWVGVLKRSGRTMPYDENAYVIARFDDLRMGGVASERSLLRIAGTPFLTQHDLGRGRVVCFSDGATTRGFTHATMRLLLNAILFGPSL